MADDDDMDLRGSIEAALNTDEGLDEVDTSVDTSTTETPEKPAVEGRDSLGRFLKKDDNADVAATDAAPVAPSAVQQAALDPAQAAATPSAPAPSGWGPAVREKWATLDPEVQQHVLQREQQMQRFVNDTAPLRQAGERFQQAVQPYMHTIQAEGVDPLTAVTNLMQVSTTLRFGTPNEKAGLVATIVKNYGIDVMALDGALAGVMPQPGQQGVDPQALQAMVDQRLQPILNMAQQRQREAEERNHAKVVSELDTFSKGKEFMNDVANIMADLIDVADKNKQDLGLQDAYDRACLLHPDVSRVIMKRRQDEAAQNLTSRARTARAAAVGSRGSAPVGNPNAPEPSSIRESLEMAIESHSRV